MGDTIYTGHGPQVLWLVSMRETRTIILASASPRRKELLELAECLRKFGIRILR